MGPAGIQLRRGVGTARTLGPAGVTSGYTLPDDDAPALTNERFDYDMAQREWHYPEVVPKLAQLGASVLYGDVWERDQLSKRDRSLITVAALIALYRPEQLEAHIERALGNGVTSEEIAEVITHMAFYAGWPAAVTAGEILSSLSREPEDKEIVRGDHS